jgi:hypothetical protein
VAAESISAGTVRSASISSSILGNYEWVHKTLQAEVDCVDSGSSPTEACEAASGRGVAAQGSREVDGSPQTTPVGKLGSHGEPTESSEPRVTPASPCMSPISVGNSSSGPVGEEQLANEAQKMQEGDFVVQVLHSGVRDSLLVPSIPGKPVLVSGILSGPVEVLCFGAITTSTEVCSMQTVEDGILALPQQYSSSGLELVPIVEESPFPWLGV